MTPKDESPRSEGVQYATGEEQRELLSPRVSEAAELYTGTSPNG